MKNPQNKSGMNVTLYAVLYRAYAIRPYKWRNTQIDYSFQNATKITFDVRKTTSYVV